ncbi:MAG: membrane protein insertase YidC [Spirochaetia bacterium]|nr:membrane protein insertase YidC [Spirochaetia bacterium]
MEKNTLVAIILCVIVISAGYFVQSVFFPVEEPAVAVQEEKVLPEKEIIPDSEPTEFVPSVLNYSAGVGQDVKLETEVFDITFNTKGATVKSIKLKKHAEMDGRPLEMINRGGSSLDAFNIYFGDMNGRQLNSVFDYRQYKQNNDSIVEFWTEFEMTMGTGVRIPLEVRKKYVFKPDEYMLELEVQMLNKEGKIIQFNNNGYAYTLEFGPQIGPEFEKLDGKSEYRRYITCEGKKRKIIKMPKPVIKEGSQNNSWAAIAGKYFTVIGITDEKNYQTLFSSLPVAGQENGSSLYFCKSAFKGSSGIDTYKFYIGPKSSTELRRYDTAEKNGFGMTKMELDRVLDSGAMLGWLQQILKWLLIKFHSLIPNYGVAIILLTILVKIVLYPLTKKSFESSSKMSALSPKLKELQTKYKGNNQKLNAEMSALYKKEGVNPMSGCLPILLQMPIFIALYGLLNSFFELRGAGFLEPWITDLSQPDSIFNFAPTSIFLIGSDIRLLPILMMATQILSSKLMQPAGAESQSQMKMITYMMPVVFLFVLYDVSSGLLLYWTMTNIISIGQQLYINYKMKKKRVAKS